jgi:hypothetical protein
LGALAKLKDTDQELIKMPEEDSHEKAHFTCTETFTPLFHSFSVGGGVVLASEI